MLLGACETTITSLSFPNDVSGTNGWADGWIPWKKSWTTYWLFDNVWWLFNPSRKINQAMEKGHQPTWVRATRIQPISRVSHIHLLGTLARVKFQMPGLPRVGLDETAKNFAGQKKHGQEPGTPPNSMDEIHRSCWWKIHGSNLCVCVLKRYKPSILGYPHFRKPLYIYTISKSEKKKLMWYPPFISTTQWCFFPSTSRRIIASADGRGLVGTCDVYLRQCVPRPRWCCLPLCWTDQDI